MQNSFGLAEVPHRAGENVVDAEAAQEGLIITTMALAEQACAELTIGGCDDIEKLLLQAASDLAKCRVGLGAPIRAAADGGVLQVA